MPRIAAPLLACVLVQMRLPMSVPGESAVEPKRSENMTVTWRRSALSRGDGLEGAAAATAPAASVPGR